MNQVWEKIALGLGVAGVIISLGAGLLSAATANRTTTLKVNNLSCPSCLYAIQGELEKQEGVISMDANFRKGLVAVEHRSPMTSERLAELVTAIGYPAEVISGEANSENEAVIPLREGTGNIGCGNNCCAASSATWKQLGARFFGSQGN